MKRVLISVKCQIKRISSRVLKWICGSPNYHPSVWLLAGRLISGLTALRDSISVCIGPSPREREKEERKDRGD